MQQTFYQEGPIGQPHQEAREPYAQTATRARRSGLLYLLRQRGEKVKVERPPQVPWALPQ